MRLRPAAVAAFVLLLRAGSLAASVTGVVVGPDGAPVANARVALFRPIPLMLLLREVSRERSPQPLASVATEQDGRFALEAGSAGLVDIHVVAEGFASADAFAAGDEDVTITLQRAPLITGRVRANGKPVPDA